MCSSDLLNDSIKSAFTTLGISHLTAVSGLHLSVITGVLLFILKKFRVNKRISSVISILITIFYMMLADFSGSIVRAGIMLIVILCAEFFGMRGDSLNSLGIAVTVLCLNPYAVCDIGAVLSVTCILAVVVVFPLFNEKLRAKYIDPLNKTKGEILLDGLFNVLSGFYTSVIVGAVTMPVCYVFFGSVSVISAVANIVAIPLGSACVVSSIVFYLLSLLNIPFVSIVAASVTYSLDNALVRCVSFFNSLGNPTFTFDYRYSYVFAAIFILIAVCAFCSIIRNFINFAPPFVLSSFQCRHMPLKLLTEIPLMYMLQMRTPEWSGVIIKPWFSASAMQANILLLLTILMRMHFLWMFSFPIMITILHLFARAFMSRP